VLHLAELCDEEPEHSAHVARLSLQLFDGLVGLAVGKGRKSLDGLDRLGEPAREYLEAGALLANVGLFISHSRHHLHSYYVIRNSEVLTGLTDHEIELIALLARYHRKSGPKARHPEFARLESEDQELVRALAGILRVAIGLDRSHDQRVEEVHTSVRDGALVVGLVPAGPAPLDLELFAASERRGLLEEVLGRPVVLEVAGG
jgi:exopolyphosphatase/guanosine-5'-triphosphate,3'-diphosphate pyrophosphatase